MKLGVTADSHGRLKKARKAASFFKKSDVDAVILAGDTPSDEKQKQNFIKILKIFSKIGKKIFILPGSHEHYKDYYSALKVFRRNKNIIDCTKKQISFLNSQKLVFLPGADVSAEGAGFRVLRDRRQLARFRRRIRQLKEHFWGKVVPYFTADLDAVLDKNSILISHIPPKFNTKEAIDIAIFGEPKKPFLLLKKHEKISKTTIANFIMAPGHVVFTLDEAKKMIKEGYPVAIKKQNSGNPWLKNLIRKKRVKFFICAHIHESGGRATNLKGKSVQQNKWSEELFYNCSGRAGIVEFSNGMVKYKDMRV